MHRHCKTPIPTFLTRLSNLTTRTSQRAMTRCMRDGWGNGASAFRSTATQPQAHCALALGSGPVGCCLSVPGGCRVSSAQAMSRGKARAPRPFIDPERAAGDRGRISPAQRNLERHHVSFLQSHYAYRTWFSSADPILILSVISSFTA